MLNNNSRVLTDENRMDIATALREFRPGTTPYRIEGPFCFGSQTLEAFVMSLSDGTVCAMLGTIGEEHKIVAFAHSDGHKQTDPEKEPEPIIPIEMSRVSRRYVFFSDNRYYVTFYEGAATVIGIGLHFTKGDVPVAFASHSQGALLCAV